MELTQGISIKSLNYYYFQFWKESCDERSKHLPLIGNGPWIVLGIMAIYLLVVIKIGPNFMKTRPPFELRGIMLFYNTIMVFTNAFTFIKVLQFSKYGLEFLNMEYPSDKILTSDKPHYLNIT